MCSGRGKGVPAVEEERRDEEEAVRLTREPEWCSVCYVPLNDSGVRAPVLLSALTFQEMYPRRAGPAKLSGRGPTPSVRPHQASEACLLPLSPLFLLLPNKLPISSRPLPKSIRGHLRFSKA